MPRPPKEVQPPHVVEVKAILATNVSAGMKVRYAHMPNLTAMIVQLHKDSGVGKGTVERIAKGIGTQYPGIDKIARIAHALRMPMTSLLTQGGVEDLLGRGSVPEQAPHRSSLQRR